MTMTLIYDEDFSTSGSEEGWSEVRDANPGINSNLVRVTGDGDPYIKAESTVLNPWWWDGNHYYPGAGYINLLAFAYSTTLSGVLPQTNYGGGKLVLEARVKDFILPQGARIVWWMQFISGAMAYNYGQTANPIDNRLGFGSVGSTIGAKVRAVKDSGWQEITVPFPTSDAAWTCYGSNPTRDGVPPLGNPSDTAFYGCAPGGIAEAMSMSLSDMGVHILWQNTLTGTPRGATPPAERALGELHIRRVRLYGNGP